MKKNILIATVVTVSVFLGLSSFQTKTVTENRSTVKVGNYQRTGCMYTNPSTGVTTAGEKCISGNLNNCNGSTACGPLR